MARGASWGKAFRDLWENKSRAILVVAALVVGIVGVGAVAAAYSILIREMNTNYLGTDPASATLWVAPLDGDLVETVAGMPQIARAEARSEITGRFLVGEDEWRELWLYVVPDFTGMELDRFSPEQGAWPPATGEILLERTAVRVARADFGDRVTVKIPNQDGLTLSFSGTVHTPGLPPAWVEGRVYGYITPATLALFGGEPALNQLKILVAENQFDKAAIIRTTEGLVEWLQENGRTVSRVDIPDPGKHVHADLMAAFISMLGAMGLLALVMSGILVTNMISAMMGRQVRQIGIMKAIGGSAGQIAALYLTMVLALGLTAIAIGMPISIALGRALADYEAVQMLNFEILDNRIDLWVYGLVAVVGLVIPLLAAAYPVSRGTRITVLAALSEYGLGQGKFGSRRIEALLGKVRGGARSFLLSLRNTFRRRGRLVLTLLTLTMAGASFITALNVRASVDKGVASKFDATPYDITIAFSQPHAPEEVERVVKTVEGVKRVETWGSAWATVVQPESRLGGKVLGIVAPLFATELSPRPQVVEGRWLRPDDQAAIVMSIGLMKKAGINATVGDDILLDIQGQRTAWQLVGITREFLASAAYAPHDSFMKAVPYGTSTVVRVTDPTLTSRVARDLELELAAAGLDVFTMWKTADTRQVMVDHMLIITGILLVMAGLFVIVGGLGLASTMSLNVLDRTRELGIMRAIGASTGNVMRIIILEGTLIGALSWVLAVILSLPFTVMMGKVIEVFLESPMALATSVGGWILWLFVVSAIAAAASAFPAGNAARQPVNKVLSYE